MFTKSLQSVLGLTTTSISNAINCNYHPSHIITTDLIWITSNSNYDYLASQIIKFKDSVFVPISIGIQAQKMGDNFKLNDSTLKVLNLIQERAIIGCRGYYTAEILNKHGITNIEVIGCPSIYFKGRDGYKIHHVDKLEDNISVISNFRTFYGRLSIKEKHFLSYCATRSFDFIEQTKYPFEVSHTAGDEKYFNYVNRWLTKKSRAFFDIEQWYKFVAIHDFSFGARFHGNTVFCFHRDFCNSHRFL